MGPWDNQALNLLESDLRPVHPGPTSSLGLVVQGCREGGTPAIAGRSGSPLGTTAPAVAPSCPTVGKEDPGLSI